MRGKWWLVLVGLALLLAAPTAAAAERYVAGDPGGGDPFFPLPATAATTSATTRST